MSITDELRKWADDNTLRDRVLPTCPPQHAVHGVLETLLRIADRIDAEHERLEHENDGLRAELGSISSDDTWLSAYMNGIRDSYSVCEDDSADLQAHGLMLLPKDADGEYIHIGDKMQMCGDNELQEVVGFYDGGFLAWRNGRYVPCKAMLYRHYHEPTVEDVLREFFSRYVTTKPKEEDDAIVAEYAAKVREVVGE